MLVVALVAFGSCCLDWMLALDELRHVGAFRCGGGRQAPVDGGFY
jgi:hypothetical protein